MILSLEFIAPLPAGVSLIREWVTSGKGAGLEVGEPSFKCLLCPFFWGWGKAFNTLGTNG